MYKVLNGYAASELKESFCKGNVKQNIHNLRRSENDVPFRKQNI